jgi:uncharacterized protein (TIGR02246 family)
MRNPTFLGLVAALALTACQPAAQPLSPADETAIREAVTAFADAASANNTDAMAALYTEDAIVHPDGMPSATGMAAIKKLWTDMAGMMRVTKFEPTVTKLSGQGDVAYVTGTFHMTMTTADSTHTALPAQEGKFVEVLWRQADKSWKVAADSWNSNTMPEAPAAPAAPARRH